MLLLRVEWKPRQVKNRRKGPLRRRRRGGGGGRSIRALVAMQWKGQAGVKADLNMKPDEMAAKLQDLSGLGELLQLVEMNQILPTMSSNRH